MAGKLEALNVFNLVESELLLQPTIVYLDVVTAIEHLVDLTSSTRRSPVLALQRACAAQHGLDVAQAEVVVMLLGPQRKEKKKKHGATPDRV